MPWLLHELLCLMRRPGQHSLEHPRPGQRPAVDFDAERAEDLDEVLAPPFVALHRATAAPTSPFPVISRDGWPYNLRSV